MGTTFSSIHVFTSEAITYVPLKFASFSDGWQSCVTDLDHGDIYAYKEAKLLSKKYSYPVLYFFIYDSESVNFEFFLDGKSVARYSDGVLAKTKNLYAVSSILNYGEGYKKRLSNIVAITDADKKVELLEEYFGVCLLPFPELLSEPYMLERERSEDLYNAYKKKEKALAKNMRSVSAKLIYEKTGKLFWNCEMFSCMQKEHCYVLLYENDDLEYSFVRFIGNGFETITIEEFAKAKDIPAPCYDYCRIIYGSTDKVEFNESAPVGYRGKTMDIPSGAYLLGFDSKNRFVLTTGSKVFLADESMDIIGKFSVKGYAVDIYGDYILTASPYSFFGYEYDPKAKNRIYKIES